MKSKRSILYGESGLAGRRTAHIWLFLFVSAWVAGCASVAIAPAAKDNAGKEHSIIAEQGGTPPAQTEEAGALTNNDPSTTPENTIQSGPDKPLSELDFYNAAEEEINNGTYDRNLWAKALVEADGDENRRKARYIELRANQLYVQTRSHSLTGTYTSEASGTTAKLTSIPKPIVWLVQNGNQISGSYGALRKNQRGNIYGTLDGETINFEWEFRGNYGKGKWTVGPGNRQLDGSWISLAAQGGGGTWNLNRSADQAATHVKSETADHFSTGLLAIAIALIFILHSDLSSPWQVAH